MLLKKCFLSNSVFKKKAVAALIANRKINHSDKEKP